jgi:nitroreductase
MKNQFALDFLASRYSCAKLTAPAPTEAEIEQMLTVGMRAPDHGCLKPTHFVVIKDKGLEKLSALFVKVAVEDNGDEAMMLRAKNMSYRAPLIIAVMAKVKEHPKVPRLEQILSAGCATFSLQQMAVALGYNGIWRTGSIVSHPIVKAAFELSAEDELVGFLYLGTEEGNGLCRKTPVLDKNVSYWV